MQRIASFALMITSAPQSTHIEIYQRRQIRNPLIAAREAYWHPQKGQLNSGSMRWLTSAGIPNLGERYLLRLVSTPHRVWAGIHRGPSYSSTLLERGEDLPCGRRSWYAQGCVIAAVFHPERSAIVSAVPSGQPRKLAGAVAARAAAAAARGAAPRGPQLSAARGRY